MVSCSRLGPLVAGMAGGAGSERSIDQHTRQEQKGKDGREAAREGANPPTAPAALAKEPSPWFDGEAMGCE